MRRALRKRRVFDFVPSYVKRRSGRYQTSKILLLGHDHYTKSSPVKKDFTLWHSMSSIFEEQRHILLTSYDALLAFHHSKKNPNIFIFMVNQITKRQWKCSFCQLLFFKLASTSGFPEKECQHRKYLSRLVVCCWRKDFTWFIVTFLIALLDWQVLYGAQPLGFNFIYWLVQMSRMNSCSLTLMQSLLEPMCTPAKAPEKRASLQTPQKCPTSSTSICASLSDGRDVWRLFWTMLSAV